MYAGKERDGHLFTPLLHPAPHPCDAPQDDAYLFDITDPRRPTKTKSAQLAATAVTDHVFGLANGNFLVTQVGARQGRGAFACFGGGGWER